MSISTGAVSGDSYAGRMVPFTRRGLHGQVVDLLGEQIVTGSVASGTVIDIEQLTTEMDVSRTVIREAMKVLSAKGLVDARPRTGTYVLPRDRWNLLDADVIRWRNRGAPDARLMVELGEVRQIIEPWGARLAAQRRTGDDIVELEQAYEELETCVDEDLHAAADVRFHRGVLTAAHNEVLLRLEIVLEPALAARDQFAFRHVHTRAFLEAHRRVLTSIRDARSDDAFVAMTELLEEAAEFMGTNLRVGPSEAAPTGSGRAGRARGRSRPRSE
jgi:GntR family transcriptional regulator, galactonate operon transcriptional repressor